ASGWAAWRVTTQPPAGGRLRPGSSEPLNARLHQRPVSSGEHRKAWMRPESASWYPRSVLATLCSSGRAIPRADLLAHLQCLDDFVQFLQRLRVFGAHRFLILAAGIGPLQCAEHGPRYRDRSASMVLF